MASGCRLTGSPREVARVAQRWPQRLPIRDVHNDVQAETDEARLANRAAVELGVARVLEPLAEAVESALGSTRDAARRTGVARSTLARIRDGSDGARLDLLADVGLASGLRLELVPARLTGREERRRQPPLPDAVRCERQREALDGASLVTMAGAELRVARVAQGLSATDAAEDAGLRSERTVRRWEAGSPPLLRHAVAMALSRGFDFGWRPLTAPWRLRPWQLSARPTSPERRSSKRAHGRLAPMLSSRHQDWATPASVVKDLLAQHGRFALDAAAAPETTISHSWLGPAHPQWLRRDALADRHGTWLPLAAGPGPVYLNPPYSGSGTLGEWLERARATAAAGRTVVSLLPARTDTHAWHTHVHGVADVVPLRGRLRYTRPGAPAAPAPFPSAIVTWRS